MARPQDPRGNGCRQGKRRLSAPKPRTRRCLLKGCERVFRPVCHQARYCSAECRAAARRWSQKRSQEAYRGSEKGRESRQRQSRAYRERVKQRDREQALAGGDAEASEGHHREVFSEGILCARPGCYERVVASLRSPLQCFCSSLCRKALHRVLEREARWRRRVASRGMGLRLLYAATGPPV
jgi:hypothetical protein